MCNVHVNQAIRIRLAQLSSYYALTPMSCSHSHMYISELREFGLLEVDIDYDGHQVLIVLRASMDFGLPINSNQIN